MQNQKQNIYDSGKRIFEIYERILKTSALEYLTITDDHDTQYHAYLGIKRKNMKHIHKCIIASKDHDFMEEYIDLYLEMYPHAVNEVCENNITPLMIAVGCPSSSKNTVRILFKHGANPNQEDDHGCDVMYVASNSQRTHPDPEMMEILLQNGANPNKFSYFYTPLMLSVGIRGNSIAGEVDVIKVLLKYGADPNIKSGRGNYRAFDYAVNTYKLDLALCLLDHTKIDQNDCDHINSRYQSIKQYGEDDFYPRILQKMKSIL